MKRKIALILVLILVIVITYNLSSRIYSALRAGERLTEALDKLHQVEIKNKELQQQLKEAATADFVEQQARDKLGFAREGETVMVIPPSKIEQVLGIAKEATIERLPNWLGWLKVFFR